MEPITIQEVVEAVNGEVIEGDRNGALRIYGISTDSRSIQQGQLFIPLKGENFDGHRFIPQAFANGAVGSLTEQKHGVSGEQGFRILVQNTKQALMDLAKFYRNKFSLPVVGVTGSVGKTSTKDMIAAVLEQGFTVLKTQGNFNNEIGLPLTVFKLSTEHTAVVLEMGMSQFGEIRNLSRIAKPKVAVITNIGLSHIENLGSQQGILKAKSEIFDYLSEDGIAILNGDDPLLRTLMSTLKQKIHWYGIDCKENYYATDIKTHGFEGVSCVIHTPKERFSVQIPAPGKHMVYNTLAAVAAAEHLGMTSEQIQQGIRNFIPTKMRMAVIDTKNHITIINDAYNASPHSMQAAIDVLMDRQDDRRKVAILGDMFEMGEYGPKAHEEIGAYAAAKGIDLILCVGDLARFIYKGVLGAGAKTESYYFQNQELLWKEIGHLLHREDMILVKASRGMQLEKTVDKVEEVEL